MTALQPEAGQSEPGRAVRRPGALALIVGLASTTAAAILGAGSFYLHCELTLDTTGLHGAVCAPHVCGAFMLIVLAPMAVVLAWSSARSSGEVDRFQITVGLVIAFCLLVLVVFKVLDS